MKVSSADRSGKLNGTDGTEEAVSESLEPTMRGACREAPNYQSVNENFGNGIGRYSQSLACDAAPAPLPRLRDGVPHGLVGGLDVVAVPFPRRGPKPCIRCPGSLDASDGLFRNRKAGSGAVKDPPELRSLGGSRRDYNTRITTSRNSTFMDGPTCTWNPILPVLSPK